MRPILVAVSLLLAVLGPVAVTAPASGQDSDKGCNVRLKGLKTLSDPQRNLVDLHPKSTTAAAINALPQLHPTPKTRSTDFSRRVWRVIGFFDIPHTQKPHAENFAELHPVTGIKFVSGCGA
jgi:hypothetical protein